MMKMGFKGHQKMKKRNWLSEKRNNSSSNKTWSPFTDVTAFYKVEKVKCRSLGADGTRKTQRCRRLLLSINWIK